MFISIKLIMKYLRKENEIFKRIELNSKQIDWRRKYPLPIKNGNCIIPKGITSIGNERFYKCSSLTTIQFLSTLITIGSYSFSNTKLTTIIIPEGITSIGDGCFNLCSTLTNISLPSTLINIGKYAFSSLSRVKVPLKQVEVPKNCKIGEHAFDYDCKVIRK